MLDKLDLEQLQQAAFLLNVNRDMIEKDYYVTKALACICSEKSEYFLLVFQGGTSLSKAYGVIQRISEDIDFRIVLKPAAAILSRNQRRIQLGKFRGQILKALQASEFEIESWKSQNEDRFTKIKLLFKSTHNQTNETPYLKPHVQIDLFLCSMELLPEIRKFSTLIKEIFGEKCNHPYFSINCTPPDETAAEKWAAITRRVFMLLGNLNNIETRDKELVRHLFDLHQLFNGGYLNGRYLQIICPIIGKEKSRLSIEQYPNMANKVLEELKNNEEWNRHWDIFLEQMVYSENKPTYVSAINCFENMTKQILFQLENIAGKGEAV